MCGTNCGCASCGLSKADGGPDPQAVGELISKILYDGQATDEVIHKAYPEVMIYLDSKGLEPTEANIAANKEALLNAIATDNKGLELSSEPIYKKPIFKVLVLAGLAYLGYKMMNGND